MPSTDLVTLKAPAKTRDRVKDLSAALTCHDCDVVVAAVEHFDSLSRVKQRLSIARTQRARGVRHPRVGRSNKLPVPAST